jgi:threonine/homoserine/homoserine lactone efflux protein
VDSVNDLFRALLAGYVCGFVVSVPVGPVNLTVINQALRRGFLTAFAAGVGAICAESIYAALMLAGHSTLLGNPRLMTGMRIGALVVITAIGIRSLLFKEEREEAHDQEKIKIVVERWHHPRSFLLGFLLTISNLMLVLLWATLATVLFAHEWVGPARVERAICVTGVFAGGVTWFFLLAFFVSRAHRRVKPQTLTVLVRACGVVFLLFAALLAYKLFVPHESPRSVDFIKRSH